MSKRKYYTVYRYDELTQKAKGAAIEKLRQAEDLLFLQDELNELLDTLLEENKIIGEAKLYYSLNYCQGDGAMFEGTFKWNNHDVVIKHQDHYYHSGCKNAEMNHSETGDDASDEVLEEFEGIYQGICQKLVDAGYAHIEGQMSDEHILSEIEERKCWFTEDGVLDECEA